MPRYINVDKLDPTNFEIFMCKGSYEKALELILEKIAKAPAEDVAPVVHAKWETGQCTNCHTDKPIVIASGVQGYVHRYQGRLNYCPNCGAKMEICDDVSNFQPAREDVEKVFDISLDKNTEAD